MQSSYWKQVTNDASSTGCCETLVSAAATTGFSYRGLSFRCLQSAISVDYKTKKLSSPVLALPMSVLRVVASVRCSFHGESNADFSQATMRLLVRLHLGVLDESSQLALIACELQRRPASTEQGERLSLNQRCTVDERRILQAETR